MRFPKRDQRCRVRFRGDVLCNNGMRVGTVRLSFLVAGPIEPGCVHLSGFERAYQDCDGVKI
jgi:hypothetical protein